MTRKRKSEKNEGRINKTLRIVESVQEESQEEIERLNEEDDHEDGFQVEEGQEEETRQKMEEEEETEEERKARLEAFEALWNRYKYGWCASYRRYQASPRPIKTIGGIPAQDTVQAVRRKVMNKQFIANDSHVPVPRHMLTNYQRKEITRRIDKTESTRRDVAVF